MKKNYNDLKNLLGNECVSCGTCIGICPTNALEFDQNENKVKLVGKCISCGLCYMFCPDREVFVDKINTKLFNKLSISPIGNYSFLGIGQSTNEKILERASSGGIVTSLLVYALEKKLIDAAIIVRPKKNKPYEDEAVLVKSVKEILGAAQSKYHPVPVNSILGTIEKKNLKVAFVASPCQVHAIRTLQLNNAKWIKNIKLIIGLFCGFQSRYDHVSYLLKKMGINDYSKIKKLEYRGGEWPGGFLVTLKNGEKKLLRKLDYNFILPLFIPERCLYCYDYTNEMADISVGDVWLPNVKDHSLVIGRTKTGLGLLKQVLHDSRIKLTEITKKDFIKSHNFMSQFKRKGSFVRMKFAKNPPKYHMHKPDLKLKDNLLYSTFFITYKIMNSYPIKQIIESLPLSWLAFFAKSVRKILKTIYL